MIIPRKNSKFSKFFAGVLIPVLCCVLDVPLVTMETRVLVLPMAAVRVSVPVVQAQATSMQTLVAWIHSLILYSVTVPLDTTGLTVAPVPPVTMETPTSPVAPANHVPVITTLMAVTPAAVTL